MQCNIDARGKAVRLVAGSVVEAIGFLLAALWFTNVLPAWAGIVGGIAVVSGLFMIFEGLAGWCAIRALGFKTPV
ncbi:MAG: hypothetical protein JNM94_04320 [Phycisphaerae bacterium]|nr:hypothetical protein [Phycisphaerae bacterium]